MAKREYTVGQKRAIYNDGHNILVSASAGSGKTSVLVERVIQKILNGEDVDRLLVVTFTEAAAAEMKERIRAAIIKQINQTEDFALKQHLSMQLNKLNNANISTLHAFCLTIIRNYYYVINMDPSFRIMADEAERSLLKEEVWSDLREDLYANDTNQQFAKLTRNFSNDRSDSGMQDLLMQLYEFAISNPDVDGWLGQLTKNYEVAEPFIKTEFLQAHVLPVIKNELKLILNKAEQLQELAYQAGDNVVRSQQIIAAETAGIKQVFDQFDQLTWDQIGNQLRSIDISGRLAGGKKEGVAEFNELAKPLRGDTSNKHGYRPELQKLINDYFKLDEEQLKSVLLDSQGLINELIRVTKLFDKRYASEKLRRHALEFNDFEHYALKILLDESTEGQNVRGNLQNKFNEIIVDEYQDINPLQESILTAVARKNPGNMFMVGDVKQSIYAFRMADPGLFLSKNENFKDDANADERIILAENFRSMNTIDQFTNLIFNQIMDEKLGEIDYDDDAQLKFGAKYYPEEIQNTTEVLVYTEEPKEAEAIDSFSKTDGQIRLIAQRIKQLFSSQTMIFDRTTQEKRMVQYGDIAILVSTGNLNQKLVETFREFDIPVEVSRVNDYFQTTEVSIMMDLLRLIDNPYQDIPLAAVLRSPIVGLNENELAFLRIGKQNDDYYTALQYFLTSTEVKGEFQIKLKSKVERFDQQLQTFRKLAAQSSLVDLLWNIYEETGFLDYVGGMPDGPQRQNNLHAFYDRAKEYEQSSFKGLFQFVRYIDRMRNKGGDLAENPVKSDLEAVRVMTIHGSKGLEFPIVFLADTSHKFNTQDSKGSYLLSRDLGIGITFEDFVHKLQIDTPQKVTIRRANQKNMLAEEMRVLYVALTRAEQKLIIVGAKKSQTEALKQWNQVIEEPTVLLNEDIRRQDNYLDWIGRAIIRLQQVNQEYGDGIPRVKLPDLNVELKFIDTTELTPQTATKNNSSQFKLDFNADSLPADASQIEQIMNFKYADPAATTTTAYQSVSEVKRVFDDPDKLTMSFSEIDQQRKLKSINRYVNNSLAVPKFMTQVVKPKPTEIGTATHLILQEIDLTHEITEAGIQELIADLVQHQVLNREIADQINIGWIMNFFQSDLGQLMQQHAKQVQRETPFSLLVPANSLFNNVKNDDSILIHGIIDAYIQLEDRVILLDYKTDFILQGDPKHGVNSVIEKYRGQINLYAEALESIVGTPVDEKYLYLLSIGQLVDVN